MTPDERRACLAALDAAQAAVAAMQALLDRHDEAGPEGDDLVPLKVAADAWGITDGAALKRAKRGAGTRVGKRWYVRRSDIEAARRVQLR